MQMRHAPLVSLLVLMASAVGCADKRVDECNRLVAVINGGIEKLEQRPAPPADGTGVAELETLAKAMEEVTASTSQVELTLPELKKIAEDYQAMTRDVAAAAKEMAAAANAKDEKRLSTAEIALQTTVKREDPLVTDLNKICQSE